MSIQIDRFEIIQKDRVDKTRCAILDHKFDKDIILIDFGSEELSKKVANAFKEKLEELINNEEIVW
jgi:hypothetical protein